MILSAVCFCVSCADITVFSFGRYYLESMHVDEGGSPSPYFHRLDDIADPVVTGRLTWRHAAARRGTSPDYSRFP